MSLILFNSYCASVSQTFPPNNRMKLPKQSRYFIIYKWNLISIVQEKYCYVSPDIQKEFAKFDSDSDKWFKQHDGINNITKKPFQIDVGYERFLAPEIFFHPEVSLSFFKY